MNHPSQSLLTAEEGLAHLLAQARPVAETEILPTAAALGRVLAAPLISTVDVPPHDNSAMDGYAFRCADCKAGSPLPVSQRIPAGASPSNLEPGTAARIFTGAPLPAGADAVAMQEDCTAEESSVVVNKTPRPGDNIRLTGDDIAAGQVVLEAGTRLRPQDLGVAASVGAAQLAVHRRLKVATLFTGDELVMPGTALKPGQIYNSNRDTLHGLLTAMGCDVVDLGQVEDTLPATISALNRAAAEADVVISSGGVSVGEEDHIKKAVLQLGKLDLWRLAIKPGKPLAFGHIDTTDFVGLPGNPVSAFATFCLFVRPFLLKRMGAKHTAPRTLMVRADFERNKPAKVREFLRVQLVTGEDGLTWAKPFRTQSSGVLTSMAWADGLAVAPENKTFEHGAWLRFYPLSELVG